MGLVARDCETGVGDLVDNTAGQERVALCPPPTPQCRERRTEWTIIIPFFNERDFIRGALHSASQQNVPFKIVLVDNGSTDDSATVARDECDKLALDCSIVRESRPGKVHALATGLAHVTTPYVATFDADTIYPATYLKTATGLLQDASAVSAQAYYVRPGWRHWRRAVAARKLIIATRMLPNQCHNGGAGQVFRTEPLRRSGGFDALRWDFILEDHEIIHRISRFGQHRCSLDLWCCPLRRERDRARVRWNLLERLAYHFTPAHYQSKFFYDFLGPRLKARGLLSVATRELRPSVPQR